jgi:hypothetical protein
MAGDIDSRASNGPTSRRDAPGANDNASGMAGVLEAARIMTQHRFGKSVVFVGLSGEEQGLWGGQHMASSRAGGRLDHRGRAQQRHDRQHRGNRRRDRQHGVPRVQSSPHRSRKPSRSARTAHARRRGGRRVAAARALRGPDHDRVLHEPRRDDDLPPRPLRPRRAPPPFNDVGFPGIRIMEAHENYVRQHQDIRVENGIAYGDVVEGVNFDYAAKLTAVNATPCWRRSPGHRPPRTPSGSRGRCRPSAPAALVGRDDRPPSPATRSTGA